MKKHLPKILAVFLLILIAGVAFAIYQIDSIVEAKIREVSKTQLEPKGINLEFEDIHIGLKFPLQIVMDNISITKAPSTKLNIEKISARIAMVDGYFKTSQFFPDLNVEVINPQFSTVIEEAPQNAPAQQAGLPIRNLEEVVSGVPAIKNLKLLLKIENLKADINKPFEKALEVQNTNLQLSFQSLQSPILLNVLASVKSAKSPLPIWIPIELNSQLQLREGVLNSAQSDLKVLAISTRSRGQIDFNNKKLTLQILAQVPALEKVPIPSNLNLPFKSWKGSLDSKINVTGSFSQPMIDGFLSLQNTAIELQFKYDIAQAQGLVTGNIQAELQSGQENLILKNTSLDLDMTQLNFTQGQMIKKPKGTPFTLKTQLSYDKNLTFQALSLKFAQIVASGSGSIGMSSPQAMPAQISFSVQPTTLNGLEKFILPLSQYPLTGSLAVNASINGDLKNASQSKIQINDLKLKNVATKIKYETPEMSLEGPITLNVESKLSIDKLAVNAGSATVSSNLNGLKIKSKDMFAKNAGEPLLVNLNAVQKGRSLNLRASHIQTSAGILNLSGTPPISPASPMNLVIDSKYLNLTKIKNLLPSFQKQIPDGTANFTATFSGRFDTENFMKSPMNINIKGAANIPKYVMAKKEAAPATKGAPPPANTESFLPNEPLMKQLKGNFNINIGEFVMDTLKAEQIGVQSQLANGSMTASANIKKIFGGEITAKSIKLNLLQNDPVINFDVESPNLRLEQALAWAMPQFQKMISGSSQLKIQGASKMPSSPQFMQSLTASGNFKMENGLVNVATIADMAKGFTSKVPMLDTSKLLPSGPVPMKIFSQFQIKNSQVQFSPFQAVTAKKEEINVKGSLNLDMNVNMSGSLFLVDVGSNSSFIQANRDAQGRLEIPLQIQGSALKPEFKYAEGTISRMTQKTAQFEKAKLMNKGKEKIQLELEKQKDKLKDKLKDIFK